MHILDEFYIKQKEKIYIQHNVVNIKQVEKQQEELFQLDEYLPNLLRSNLPYSYHKQLESSEKNEDIIKQMYKSKRFTDEEETIEFINWVDKHNQFKDLINEKEVKKLGDELEKLEKYINKLQKKRKREILAGKI